MRSFVLGPFSLRIYEHSILIILIQGGLWKDRAKISNYKLLVTYKSSVLGLADKNLVVGTCTEDLTALEKWESSHG